MLWEAKEESPTQSRWGHSKGSFPGKEVALELLSFIWKDEEAKGVGLGTSFLAEGAECATTWKPEATCAA